MKSEVLETTANCTSQMIRLLNLIFIKMSFVPLLSLFLILMIFSFSGLLLLIL